MAENDNSILKLFGFELKRAQTQKPKEQEKLPSIVPSTDDDGAGYITASGSHYGQYIDFEGTNSLVEQCSNPFWRQDNGYTKMDLWRKSRCTSRVGERLY